MSVATRSATLSSEIMSAACTAAPSATVSSGRTAITGGCSKITQDIPPFMMVDGNPARVRAVNVVGLRRRGFSEEAIRTAKRAHRKLYRENLTVSKALEELAALEDPHGLVAQIVDFVKASERGIH